MKKLFTIIALFAASSTLFAQSGALLGGFFVENYKYGHNMNPAFASDQGYVGIPFISSTSASTTSTLGITDIFKLLPDGRTATFLHKDVPVDEALAGFGDFTTANADLGYDILSVGALCGKKIKGFLTVDWSIRASEQSNLPKGYFELFKKGQGGKPIEHYNLPALDLALYADTRFAIGYSFEVPGVKNLRIGAKAKLLLGLSDAYVRMENMDITLTPNLWTIKSYGIMSINSPYLGTRLDENGKIQGLIPNYALGLSSFGATFDFGITYTIPVLDGLKISASVVDLGFVKSTRKHTKYFEANGEANYAGILGVDITKDNAFGGSAISNAFDEFKTIINFYKADVPDNPRVLKPTTKVYAGIQQAFLNNIMSVGLLYSGFYGEYNKVHELTVAYSIHPSRVFDVTFSYSFLNTRTALGFLLNFTPAKGVNIFFGTDYLPLTYASYLPAGDAFVNAQFGISVPFGPVFKEGAGRWATVAAKAAEKAANKAAAKQSRKK